MINQLRDAFPELEWQMEGNKAVSHKLYTLFFEVEKADKGYKVVVILGFGVGARKYETLEYPSYRNPAKAVRATIDILLSRWRWLAQDMEELKRLA